MRRAILLSVILGGAVALGSARADNYGWNGGARDNLWFTVDNWTVGGGTPASMLPGSGDSVAIGSSGSGGVTISGGDATAQSLSLSGSPLTVAADGTLTIGTVGTSGNLLIGDISLGQDAASVDVSGSLTVHGDVRIGTSNSGGSTTGNALTIETGGSATVDGGVVVGTGASSGTNTLTVGGSLGAGSLTVKSDGVVDVTGTLAITGDGQIGGANDSSATNGGTLTIETGGSASFGGTLTVGTGATSGTNTLTIGGAFSAGALTVKSDGLVNVNVDTTVNNLNGDSGATIKVNGSTLTVTGTGAYGGAVNDGDAAGNLTVGTADTAGTLTLTGESGYTGATDIVNGTLILADTAGGALVYSSGVNVSSGATLDISTSSGEGIRTISGAGTIVLGAQALSVFGDGDMAFSGVITDGASGSGGALYKTNSTQSAYATDGTGVLTLTGANTYTGLTAIETGTIALSGSGSISDSVFVAVNDGATFDISGLTNGGTTIRNLGDGWSGLTGTGVVALGGNTLRIVIDGDAPYATTFSGSIEDGGIAGGTGGGIVKDGAGTLILAGANTYTGTTEVAEGTLEVDGSLGTSSQSTGLTTVDSGATLRGTGTIYGDVTVGSGGNLAVGSADGLSGVQTLAIGGNLRLAATVRDGDVVTQQGSTTTLRVASINSYDTIAVGGSATLGGALDVEFKGGMLNNQQVTLLSAAGGLSGTFDTVENLLQNAVTYKVSYVGDDVILSAVQNSYVPFVQAGNQAAAARAIDAATGNSRADSVFQALNSMSGGQLSRAFSQITPTSATSAPQLVQAATDQIDRSIMQRLAAVRDGSTGLSLSQIDLGPDTVYDPRTMLASTSPLAPTGFSPLTPSAENPWGTFLTGLGGFGKVDGGSEAPGYSYNSAGLQGGLDRRIDRSFAVGVAAGYQHTKSDYDDSASAVKIDTGSLQLYSTWQDVGGNWASASVGGAYHHFDSRRDGLDGQATAHTQGLEGDFLGQFGHDFKMKQWTLTPEIGLSYSHLAIDRYTESGSLTPLTVNPDDSDSLRSDLGGKAAYRFTALDVEWQPYVEAGWQHEMLDTNHSVAAQLASGAGGVFDTVSQNVGRDSATGGVGIGAAFTPTLTLRVGYDAQANNSYFENNVQATLRLLF
jgi:fibronectin-binding autotransporter adhesin